MSSNSNAMSLDGISSVKELATTRKRAQSATMSMTPTKLKVSKEVSKSLDDLKMKMRRKPCTL